MRLRNAEISDIPTLEELYRAHSSRLEIFVERDADHWTYMIRDAKLIVRLAERAADGTPVGYVVCSNESSTGNLYILENSIPGHEDAQEVLSILAGECRGELAVRWPESSTLARIAADLGSTRVRSTQWLFMMPNIPAFLTKLLPLFSARLSESAYAKSSVDLVVNLFREAFLFRVHNGRVERVESIGFRDASMGAEGGDLLIPRDAFVRLVMGHNDLSELRDPWPDIVVKPESRHLIEVLFPKLTGYLYTPYHYSNGEFYG